MAIQVGPAIELIKKYGPKLGPAISAVAAFLVNNPDVPRKIGATLRRVVTQVALVYLKRGDAAKASGNLRIVRDAAPKLGTEDASSAEAAAAWLKRADAIEVGLQLAAGLSEPEKKTTLADLRQRSEVLLADGLKATIRD